MTRQTVWHVSSNRWNSAITEYALSCARATSLLGHRSVFSPLVDSPAAVRAQAAGVETQPISNFNWLSPREFDGRLESINPGLIVTYGGPETVLARRAKDCRVVRFRGQEIEGGFLNGFRQRLGLRAVDAIITPSVGMRERLQALSANIPVHAVMLGCDEGKFHLRPTPRRAPAEVVLLGRFDPVKGHADAFSMHKALLDGWNEEAPKPVLHVVGEPANLSVTHLEHAASKVGLVRGVEYKISARRIDDVADLMSGAAIGLVSSVGSEVICRVAEEFLLCGTPVIVSGVGSLEEVLFDGAGASYRGRSPSEAAALLSSWIRRSMGETEADRRSRCERALTRMSLPAMASELKRCLGL